MRPTRFIYNEHTLQYEPFREPVKVRAARSLLFLTMTLACAAGLSYFTYAMFPSAREQQLSAELAWVESRYAGLAEELATMGKVLDNVQERDASAHRMVFGMDPIDVNVWGSGVGGSTRELFRGSTEDLIADAERRAERLKRQLVLQSKSLDTITALARDRERMLAAMPSIKPVRSDKLARSIRMLSGFGMRIHPIFKHQKMHTGLDFTAPIGTPVQATGEGVVEDVLHERSGYGQHVIIDHGFGYKTLYGHLSKVTVKRGQRLSRGEVLGLVGSTGTSTGPHLHYEVILRGEKVDPIHYCMDGLSPKEYQELVNDASAANQSFD